jgi:hypothetical protein
MKIIGLIFFEDAFNYERCVKTLRPFIERLTDE